MDPIKSIINQEPSKISLSILIDALNRDNKMHLFHEMKNFGIDYHEYQFLFYLYYEKTAIQEEIAKLFRRNESTITRALKKLEDKELINRQQDENNRRKNIVSLNEKGIEIVECVQKADEEWEKETLSIFSSKDKLKLKKVLKKIIVNHNIKREKMNEDLDHIVSRI